MATGIEQLGALAGPVNQGDVVMRQSEAPAGAAAILNKMARKNTPGVYKLPDTKPATPEFMQSAMANVQRDLTNMARNVESVGPDGHMLAYITPEEAGILKLLGGSGDINPATGIPQFDDDADDNMGAYLASTAGGTKKKEEKKTPVNVYQQAFQQGYQGAGDTGDTQTIVDYYQEREKQGQSGMPQQIAEVIAQDSNIGNINIDPNSQTAQNLGMGIIKGIETGQREPEEYDFFQKMIEEVEDYDPAKVKLGMPMSMLGQVFGPFGLKKDDPKRLFRTDEEGELTDERTLEGLKKQLKELGGKEGMEMLKRYRPDLYYKFEVPMTSGGIEELSKAKTIDTSGMARNSKEYKDAMAYNNKVFAARQEVGKDRASKNQTGGAGAPPPETGPVVPTEEGDPRAGAFAVGGTMPYTGERTGGVEMEVPLGRRFELGKEGEMATAGMDLQDAMKYATMGGYQQLEPFQEYIKRRRAYLGEEEPEYFDEEGNVIYSGVN